MTHAGTLEKMIGAADTGPDAALESKPDCAYSCACSCHYAAR